MTVPNVLRADSHGDLPMLGRPSMVDRFIVTALRNPINAEILRRLPALGLADCWLVAGCLFQATWNLAANRPVADGVKDYDLFYFDPDLSWEAEDRAIARVCWH